MVIYYYLCNFINANIQLYLLKINQDDKDKDGYVSFSEFVTIFQNIQEIEF